MSLHCMIDLETFSTANDAAIVSIGAAKFDPLKLDTTEERFYLAIDPVSAQACGFRVDAATVLWWMAEERDVVRRALLKDTKVDLPSALEGFALWYGKDSLPTWGNGATFDLVIMRNAYRQLGLDCPWSYRDERCYRTLKSLAPKTAFVNSGAAHHALDDAVAQTHHLQRIVADLGLGAHGL